MKTPTHSLQPVVPDAALIERSGSGIVEPAVPAANCGSESEASGSAQTVATDAAAVELYRRIDVMVRQASRDRVRASADRDDFAEAYYKGRINSLVELREWIATRPIEQPRGGNDKLRDAAQ